ncbi:MAG: 3-oxoadipate enol-lactonase [Pseudomonadota bacterium]
MRFVTTTAGSIHWDATGPEDGAPVLFSNSLGTDFRIWDKVLPLLPEGLRIIRYDKRGHGLSDCNGRFYNMSDHVADAAAVLEGAGVKDAVIVGLSIGGMIAQGLAAKHPDLIRGVVLCDTAAKIGTPGMWADRIAAVEKGGIEALEDSILERWFSKRFHEEEKGELALWRNMLVRTSLDGYAGSSNAIARADFHNSTATLRIPAVALCGDEDGSTPPDLVRETVELIPGGNFHLIKGAGHLPCIEKPVETANIISDFLKDIGHV